MISPEIRAGLQLLKQRNFAFGFFAYLVSYSGTAMAPIAMAFGVLELTGSTSDSAFVIAAPVAAQLVLLLISGTLADRTSRKKMLVGSDLLAMIAQFAIAALFLTGTATVPWLAGLMFILGCAFALNVPSATGFITQIVEKHELQAANALLGLARNSAITLGAALAGMLVAFLGPGLTLLLDAMTFGISAVLISWIVPRAQTRGEKTDFLSDLKLGWQEFTRHTWLWVIVLQFSLVVAASEAVWGLLGPAIARRDLGGAVSWGFVAASMGVGTAIGGLVAMQLKVRRPMFLASMMVFSFSLVSLSLSVPLSVPFICLAAFIGGVGGQIFGVLWYTTLQKVVPHHMLSRVSAYDHLGSIGLAPLGIVVGGLLFEWIGGRYTMWLAAGFIIVPTMLVLMVRDVRELQVPD